MLKGERIKTLKIIVIPFLILLIIFTVCLTGCGLQMKKYYNNDKNYSTLNGIYLGIYKESFLYIKYSPYEEKPNIILAELKRLFRFCRITVFLPRCPLIAKSLLQQLLLCGVQVADIVLRRFGITESVI